MQYGQRKLQRSVTEMRRSRIDLPMVSATLRGIGEKQLQRLIQDKPGSLDSAAVARPAAFPRWLTAFFSSSDNWATVRLKDGRYTTGS